MKTKAQYSWPPYKNGEVYHENMGIVIWEKIRSLLLLTLETSAYEGEYSQNIYKLLLIKIWVNAIIVES
jgi:hypothetical protein